MFKIIRFSYKIKKIYGVCLTSILSFSLVVPAQELKVIKKSSVYLHTVKKDSSQRMVELKKMIPDITYELYYATPNNFTGRKLYKSSQSTFLRLPVAKALFEVSEELGRQGLGIKVFDAYRPYHVTVKMWELVHDERYVANPSKGSGHNRGISVDLTLIDLETGNELDMGTGFDNFTDSAHHDFKNLSSKVLQNRTLLKQSMEQKGFTALSTEWWHYSWPNNRNYQVLDLEVKKLKGK